MNTKWEKKFEPEPIICAYPGCIHAPKEFKYKGKKFCSESCLFLFVALEEGNQPTRSTE